MEVAARAWAKINLALSVGPPEPAGSARAGWHRIASWMHAVDLFDDVTVEAGGDGFALDVGWADDAARPTAIDWPPQRDLCARAHALLESRSGRRLPARVRVRKRIPAGAGLGGGSSDAAAVLAALDGLYGLGLGGEGLRDLGLSLGSDLPYFLDEGRSPPRAALVMDFGGRVERVASARAGVVLVVPAFSCDTRDVYGAYDRLGAGVLDEARVRALAGRERPEFMGVFNDLAPAAEAVAPGLGPLREKLRASLDMPVHVTGSGSGLFVLCAPEMARGIADLAAPAAPGAAVICTRLV